MGRSWWEAGLSSHIRKQGAQNVPEWQKDCLFYVEGKLLVALGQEGQIPLFWPICHRGPRLLSLDKCSVVRGG